jgi:hypothetical protein
LELEVSALPRFCAGLIGGFLPMFCVSLSLFCSRIKSIGLLSQKSEALKCAWLKARKVELLAEAEFVGLF